MELRFFDVSVEEARSLVLRDGSMVFDLKRIGSDEIRIYYWYERYRVIQCYKGLRVTEYKEYKE